MAPSAATRKCWVNAARATEVSGLGGHSAAIAGMAQASSTVPQMIRQRLAGSKHVEMFIHHPQVGQRHRRKVPGHLDHHTVRHKADARCNRRIGKQRSVQTLQQIDRKTGRIGQAILHLVIDRKPVWIDQLRRIGPVLEG